MAAPIDATEMNSLCGHAQTGVSVGLIEELTMRNKMFVVREDSAVEVMYDISDPEIVNMIGSDYFPAVFGVANAGIEYAFVDLNDESVEWKTAVESEVE